MAYVSFQQAPDLPPGAGIFTTDTGKTTPLVYLPDEAAKLQQPEPLPAPAALPALASNDAPSFDSLAGLAGGGRGAVPPSVADLALSGGPAAGAPPPPLGAPMAGPAASNAHSAPPPIGGPLTEAASAAPLPATGGGPATPEAPGASAGGFVPSPPVGGAGGASHYQKSITHEVTPSLSPENLAATKEAMQASADTQAENLKREQELQTTQMLHAGIRADIARDEAEQARQREKAARDSQAKWDAQWQAAQKEDPTDVWHGNIFANVLGIIGQAMGAYGASITHTDNWAAKLVSQMVDQNVKVQMAKRQGLYQRMRDAGADAEQAANAVKAASYDAAAREAEQFAAQRAGNAAGAQAAQVAADLRKQQQGVINENQLAEQGKTSVTTAQSGSSGGGGGGDRDAWIIATRNKMRAAGMDTTAFDRRYNVAGQGGEGADARTVPEQKLKGASETALDGFATYGPRLGMTRNRDGSWNPPKVTTFAQAHAQVGSDAYNARKNMISAMSPEIATVRANGRAPTKEELEDVKSELSTLSPQQLATTFNTTTQRATRTIGQKIYHGKNQVPGSDEGEQP